ncbi:amidohydrolase 3 [Hypoxylon trugodes]|uniref:amidohydrolase 3 n=1 Tax=Hypoxylon trugodes TaxID=326681 RepID=UPI002197C858|nr:amidohydrolase 3 [Hypoxylon trugodes]KAI1387870.1 amidohydrolase 3 [Hypoxylon trugodes]
MAEKIILVNGCFFTPTSDSEDDPRFCDCMVIEDSKIIHVGKESDGAVHSAWQKGAEIINLEDRVVVPGFIDSHVHLFDFGLSLQKLDISTCESLEQIRQAVSTYAKLHPELPRLLCRGWRQHTTDGLALASMLDDIDPRPTFIEALDCHSSWCNTAALNELPIDKIKKACGDNVTCDSNGKPTGLLAEIAQFGFVMPHIATTYPSEAKHTAVKKGLEAYTKAGYTGVIDMAMDANSWAAFELYRDTYGLPMHISAHWFIHYEEDEKLLLQHVDEAIAMHNKYHPSKSPDLCVLGVKLICDGVIDGCTAALSHPYSEGEKLVDPIWPKHAIELVVKKAIDAGLQCAIHAIGDVTITHAIDAIANAKSPNGRHRIEHLELASEEDAKRLGQLGITASIQPVHSDPVISGAFPKHLQEYLQKRIFPYREFLDGGANVAIGTDAPTARHYALPNLYNATTRKSALEPSLPVSPNAHNVLTLSQAVTAATYGAAYSRFAETWTGSLKRGLRADFVVLDTAWTLESLLEAKVYQTWAGGNKLYQANYK